MVSGEIQAWADRVAGLSSGTGEGGELLRLLAEPRGWQPEAVHALLAALPPAAAGFSAQPKALWAWQQISTALSTWFRTAPRAALASPLFAAAVQAAALPLYRDLAAASELQWQVLGWLAAVGTAESTAAWCECLVTAPPRDQQGLPQAFAPWFRPGAQPERAFPAILAGLEQPGLAAAILDLANYVARQNPTRPHPAQARLVPLLTLLGAVTQQLQLLAERAAPGTARDPQQRAQVNEAIALSVSLCDTLALLGDPAAVGKLHQALDLPHRRVQTEAAAALARLGDPHGIEVLKRLASDPGARLRVLTYAAELGLLEQIPESERTPTARAAGELASWLGEPGRFGAPPTELHLVDNRELNWPGYAEPQACFLFRFVYQLPGGDLQNIGMAGPCTHALRVDVTEFAAEDLYAIFAGLHATHSLLNERRIDAGFLARHPHFRDCPARLAAHGYENAELQWLGQIFEAEYLVWSAERHAAPGTAICSSQEIVWIPAVPAGFTADLAYALFKGKKLLQALNRGG